MLAVRRTRGSSPPNGRELWVTVRGEDYVSVIDPKKMKEVRRVKTGLTVPAWCCFVPTVVMPLYFV